MRNVCCCYPSFLGERHSAALSFHHVHLTLLRLLTYNQTRLQSPPHISPHFIFSHLFHPLSSTQTPSKLFPKLFCTVSIFNYTKSCEWEGCCCITELKLITAWLFMSHPNARKVEVHPRRITHSTGYWAEVMRRVWMFISLSVQMFVCQSGWGDVCSVVEILWILVRLHPIAWERPNPAKYGGIIWTL